ncbi:MAG: hypothetical protein WB780_06320 [Candidatus Acidiferrales bacterium]
MIRRNSFFAFAHTFFFAGIGLLAASSALAQVAPKEIANPKLSATEADYLPQLQSLQLAIGQTQFRLPFILTRYVGLDPSQQKSLDTRGLEFVYFQNRMLLKTSGFYSAAFDPEQLTSNERAGRTFQEVVIPILRIITEQISPEIPCDGIGFEIAYHTRAARKNSDFEGREILAVVLDRADAFAFLGQPGISQQQAILNRSEIYVDGKPFGLALGRKDPLNVEALERSVPDEAEPAMPPAIASATPARWPVASPRFSSGGSSNAASSPSHAAPAPDAKAAPSPAPTQADVDRLQTEAQPQFDALLKEAGAQFHLVEYAPPSFALYHKQLVLQLTLRSPLTFEKDSSSIYKRAAQSFDLFLAPQLKPLIPRLPLDPQVGALDFSVLNHLGAAKDSSEAIEFICPLKSIRSFIEDEITSQDLIDQSLVIVNGVRINLHLEMVE